MLCQIASPLNTVLLREPPNWKRQRGAGVLQLHRRPSPAPATESSIAASQVIERLYLGIAGPTKSPLSPPIISSIPGLLGDGADTHPSFSDHFPAGGFLLLPGSPGGDSCGSAGCPPGWSARQHDKEKRFGILLELGQGVQFREHLQAQQLASSIISAAFIFFPNTSSAISCFILCVMRARELPHRFTPNSPSICRYSSRMEPLEAVM